MGSRSRKRRPRPGTATAPERAAAKPAGPDPAPQEAMRRGYARGRARDEKIRAGLEPLAPGERPTPVTAAAIVAFAFAIANIALALSGNDLAAEEEDPVFITVVTTVILVVAGVGMLRARYWAVLGFQAVLALQIIVLSLALLVVEKWWVGVGMVIVIGLLGWLFWKLVRAMARLQMPQRRPSETSR